MSLRHFPLDPHFQLYELPLGYLGSVMSAMAEPYSDIVFLLERTKPCYCAFVSPGKINA